MNPPSKKKILVADDQQSIRSLVTRFLSNKYAVLEAEDGEEALEMSRSQKPDLILLDIMMPKMDGYEAMRELRKQKKFKKLPIIALTAKAMRGDKNKCIDAGASDYLAKPVNSEKLLSMMRAWLY